MDPNGLAFDTEAMLAGLRPWVECESPTWDAAAVERMLDLAAAELARMGATIERLPGTMGFAGCVRATPAASATRPRHPRHGPSRHRAPGRHAGGAAVAPRRATAPTGPGIMDMKGGVYAALEALRRAGRAGIATALPVTVLLTPDEEVGSPSTRALIEAEAARHRAVLIPEPAQQNGGVTTGRYAIARFDLRATGRPSHAGARLAEGRSAIARDGAADPRDRGDDHARLHVQRRRGPWRAVGQLRGDHLRRRGAQHGQAAGRSRPRRRPHAGAHAPRRGYRLRGHARRHPAGLGSQPGHHGALRAGPGDRARRSASPCRMAAPAAARTATSPARLACRRWTGSASRAPGCTRSTSTSRVDSLPRRGRLLAGLLAERGWLMQIGAVRGRPGRSPATLHLRARASSALLAFLVLPASLGCRPGRCSRGISARRRCW